MSTYTYSLSTDFGGNFNNSQFVSEIKNNVTITTDISYINTNDDDIDIVFVSALSAPEVTELDTLKNNYTFKQNPKVNVVETNADFDSSTTLQFNQTGNRTITLPDATDTLVGRTVSQTLQNKKLTTTNTEIADNTDDTKVIKFDTSSSTSGTELVFKGIQTGNRTITFPDTTDTLVCLNNSQTLSNKSLVDSSISFVNNADSSKKAEFALGGASSSSTLTITSNHSANRTITIPDTTDTVVCLNNNQTLTNKIISANNNTISNLTAANITDFDTEVSNNTSVTANTAKVSADGSITTHSDIVITSVVDNEVLSYNTATSKWINQTPAEAGLSTATHTHATTDITSGTFANARISESSVTQHESAITHQNLAGAGTNTHAQIDTHIADDTKHRIINDSGTLVTELFSASKIISDLGTKSNTGHTHVAANITDLTTSTVPEGTNLYYTEARVNANTNVTANTAKVSADGSITTHSDIVITATTDNEVLSYNTATSKWINQTPAEAGLSTATHTHATTDITSGTFANARISEASVTQHESAITHQNLTGAGTNTHAQIDTHLADDTKHRIINDGATGSTELFSASKIISELATKSNTGHTHVASNITDFDTAADARISLQKAAANGLATLDGGGKVPSSQLSLSNVLYVGTWNADTNTPTLTNGTGTQGNYYVVSVTGSTNIDGVTEWNVGDWVIFNGTVWEKSDHTDAVTSVAGKQGAITLQLTDITDLATTSDLPEGTNLYYTEARVNANSNVTANTAKVSADGSVATHSDVVVTSVTDNEVLAYDTATSKWINQTSAEAGLATASHTHATGDITSGTFVDARIAQSNVTQHQAALAITESQISDLKSYGDVSGPVSSTDNYIPRFDGTTGKLLQGPVGGQVSYDDNGAITISGSKAGYMFDVHNTLGTTGGAGFKVRAGETLGDIAFHIADQNDTFQIMEMEADQGYITLGKTYAQTLIDNGAVHGFDIQHSGNAKDFNTQSGVYRIGGVDVVNVAQTLTNKTITSGTNSVRASELATTGASVVITGGAPPTSGQVLTAQTATTANWQSASSGISHDRQMAHATNLISTTSTTYIDLNSITLTTKNLGGGGTYVITFFTSVANIEERRNTDFELMIGGVSKTYSTGSSHRQAQNERSNISLTYMMSGITNGTILKIRWKTEGGTVTCYDRGLTIDGILDTSVVT